MSLPHTKRNICGPNIQRIRESKIPPMTQEQLAIELQKLGWDIDRFGISRIERGQRQLLDKELLLLANVLEVSMDEIFKG